MLNFIDTPGHVDFGYEVSRALKACEGALLIVDAAQGVEAQTVVNTYLAVEQDLELIPVLNKIDLPGGPPDEIADGGRAGARAAGRGLHPGEREDGRGDPGAARRDLREAARAAGSGDRQTRALIFDAVYDDYRGVVLYCRVFDGEAQASATRSA
jgi:GTP-binding protein LepA